jgi:hypothetical protein
MIFMFAFGLKLYLPTSTTLKGRNFRPFARDFISTAAPVALKGRLEPPVRPAVARPATG